MKKCGSLPLGPVVLRDSAGLSPGEAPLFRIGGCCGGVLSGGVGHILVVNVSAADFRVWSQVEGQSFQLVISASRTHHTCGTRTCQVLKQSACFSAVHSASSTLPVCALRNVGIAHLSLLQGALHEEACNRRRLVASGPSPGQISRSSCEGSCPFPYLCPPVWSYLLVCLGREHNICGDLFLALDFHMYFHMFS